MPEFRFPIRYYECDAYGHLNNGSYLRYIEEAIVQSGAGLSGNEQAVAGVRHRWRIQKLAIEYLQPAYYGDIVELEVATSRQDAGRRELTFVFRRVGHDDPIASSVVETIAWESSPPQRAALSETYGALDERTKGLPPAPAPPEGVYTMSHGVSWHDLDMTRDVSEVTLLGLADRCGLGVITAYGWPPERMVSEGFAIILRWHKAVFLLPAQLGDELAIATWVSDVKRASAIRHYAIRRVADEELLARIDTLGVWIDIATGRPMRIPAQFLSDFASNVSPV
jgi:acyl-CoA thioester hydrolase